MKSRKGPAHPARRHSPAGKTSTSRPPRGVPPARAAGNPIEKGRLFRPLKGERWVIGIHSVMEALKVRPKAAREIWLRDDFEGSQQLKELSDLAQRHKIPVKPQVARQLDILGSGHQGAAIVMLQNPELDWDKLKEPGQKIVIVLDGIEDPHNLGSILRTSWLTGVTAILIPEDRAVGVTPSVCKVASGGAEHVPVESHTNLPSILKDLKDAGFWVYGLSEKGENTPWKLKLPEKVAWVIGSEGSGIRIPTERACDELVRIPQVASGSSFNAAIATAMALGETCRQFGKPE
jgi:23S rRNA (guanosine2251-2'-O)-methyltransferase